jgi:circadian clock protein KaiC
MMITIKCPTCQTDNLYDAEFCRHCGLRLAKDCPGCGAANPHQFTYCTECGHSLAPAAESKIAEKAGTNNVTEEAAKAEIPAKAAEELNKETKVEVEVKQEIIEKEIKAGPTVKPEAVKTEAKTEIKEEVKQEKKPEVFGGVKGRPAMDIAVPDRVLTGISGLDPLIGGGFLAGKVYLVSGESGTGKTVFGMQFLYEGLMLGENGIYVSGDKIPTHLIVNAESLGWNFKKYIEERKLGLMDISSHFTDIRMGKVKSVDVNSIVTNIARYVKDFGAKRIVIDTIAPLVFGQELFPHFQEYVRHLVFTLEDNLGCTIVITSNIPSGSSFLSHYGVEEFVAEGVIVLGILDCNGYRFRTLSVRKMRSTFSDLNDHVFEILPQRGIVIKG